MGGDDQRKTVVGAQLVAEAPAGGMGGGRRCRVPLGRVSRVNRAYRTEPLGDRARALDGWAIVFVNHAVLGSRGLSRREAGSSGRRLVIAGDAVRSRRPGGWGNGSAGAGARPGTTVGLCVRQRVRRSDNLRAIDVHFLCPGWSGAWLWWRPTN